MFRAEGGTIKYAFAALMMVMGSLAFSSPAEAAAGINKQINFQGKVVNTDGTNVTNGSYNFLLCLYTTASPATACTAGANNDAVWRESKSLTVTDGVFQTELGDTTALPGSVDFNTDNIYLGINFNSNGQMTPLIRFTATPYAFNADKIHGLSVTDTTGTLTVPNGKTISFADAFTTSGAFPLTLTTTASSTLTLPSGTETLVGRASTDTLTNKTIGSTGLTFSGATTDITTASGESLVIVAAGAGTVDIQDATTVDSLTADTGGVSIASGQSYTGAGAVTLSSGGASGLTLDSASGVVTVATGDFLSLSRSGVSGAAAGYIWYDSSDNKFKVNENGTTKVLCNTTDLSCGSGSTTWDTIGDAVTTGAVAMADWAQTLDWNTNNVTAIGMDGLTVTITNDAATDVLTQRAFVVANQDDSASTGTTETITQIVNRDANETVTNGLLIENTGTGTMTNGIQIAETAGTITDGILITGTLGNILNSSSLDITGAGAITGATGVSSTTGTFSSTVDAQGDISDSTGNLTLNDAVDISGALAVSGTSLTATSATTITFGSTGADTIIVGNGGADTITIGNAASTGVSIVDNNWSVTTAGVASFITGTVIGSQTFTTNNIADSGALTIASGSATALTLNSGTTGTINIGTDASAETINIGNTGAAVKTIKIGDQTQANVITIGTTTAGSAVSLLDDNWSIGTGGAASFTSVTSSGAIAANGGITFDNSTDTVGSFTSSGTILMNSNILQDIGNTGTDFIASTGALTLAGVLTANGGISLSASQSISAAALAYVDLGAITHSTTANQGLRLPNAASATPSNPTSGEGYLAWDAAGNQLITYNGSAWTTLSGGSGYNLIKDETTSLTARTTLAFLGAGVSCADSGSQTECTISGGGSSDLQATYGADADGSNATISLTSADDSVVISNPASAGTDSTFTFKVEQLNTGIANDAVSIDNRGTGNGLRIDDQSGDTTPFIVDADGRVGIGTSSISATAATERLLQVGSETNRGNTAIYGEVISQGQRDITALTNIKDIYVYDTTADSDGGRWIDWATTDKLSWYTETLDDGPSDPCNIATDDRCYKASFPRKAILVVTSDALYIFDAQDNTMWMKFSQNASGYALGVDTNNDPSSVTAQNGVIYVGTNGTSAGGLYAIDFTSDRMWNYDATDRSGADVGIGSRNSAVTYNSDNNTNFDLGTVGTVADWARINDVSATVIQNSMTIDSTTQGRNNGSTVVALATDSGLTVINLSTQKVFQYSDATDNDYNAVYVTRGGYLYGLNETLGQAEQWRYIDNENIASRVNGTPNKFWDETTTPLLSKAAPTIIAGAPDALEVVERGSLADGGAVSSATVPGSSDLIYVGTNQGMTEIHDHFTSAMGWSKFYNTTRETAIMPGTIRRMHPMDDASGDVTNAAKSDVLVAKGTPTYGVNGVRGKAMQFNGTSQYLCSGSAGTCANSANDAINTGSFNFTMWFNHTAGTVTGVDTLFADCYTTTPAAATGCIAAAMNASGQMVFTFDDDALWSIGAATNNDFTFTSTQTFNDGQWHFLTFSKNGASSTPLSMIDGKVISYAGTAASHTTMSGSQILGVGTDCSTGAACGTGGNFWDGKIDDFTFSACGTAACTTDGFSTTAILSYPYAQRLYNDARPTVNRKTITVTDATTATSTTIGDSGEAWIPNEFAGMIVELNGGTGSGQTRRVVGNTTTVMTVSPAFTTTPDTTTDFQVQPEKLYGASDSVTSIGITAESPIGEARMLCAGTNSTTDTGGVTCFNHQAGPSLVAEVFHADAKQVDDGGTEWTGTDYDDIQSIDFSGRALVIGSMAHFFTETQDVRLGQGLDYVSSKLNEVRMQVLALGNIPNFAGMPGLGVGLTGGADLAENYYSDVPLEAGTVVAMDTKKPAYVNPTGLAYQKDMLGIVATSPGIVLGDSGTNGYPIALAGRVPVKVTNENGHIYAGDRITSASRSGYAMRAVQGGHVLGAALQDASDWTVCEGEDPNDMNATLCTTVIVFVNLTDYSGIPVDLAMQEKASLDQSGIVSGSSVANIADSLDAEGMSIRLAAAEPTHEEKIMAFLKEVRDTNTKNHTTPSEIFTGRVAASDEVITPTLIVDEIRAKRIKADSIEGLQIFTDQIGSLQEKYAGLEAATNAGNTSQETSSVIKEQLAIAMKKLSVDSLVVQMDGSILGKLSVDGALRIGGDAQFDGETVFSQLASFVGDTIFKGKVSFEKAPTFGSDTAGFAVIQKGSKKVYVSFETAYAQQPIVAVSLTNDVSPLLDDQADKDLKADIALVEKDYLETVFGTDLKYVVTEKSKQGFTIVLSKKAPVDLHFSWVAIAVKKAATAVSDNENEDEGTKDDAVVSPPTETVTEIVPVSEQSTIESTPHTVTSPVTETVGNASVSTEIPSNVESRTDTP